MTVGIQVILNIADLTSERLAAISLEGRCKVQPYLTGTEGLTTEKKTSTGPGCCGSTLPGVRMITDVHQQTTTRNVLQIQGDRVPAQD